MLSHCTFLTLYFSLCKACPDCHRDTMTVATGHHCHLWGTDSTMTIATKFHFPHVIRRRRPRRRHSHSRPSPSRLDRPRRHWPRTRRRRLRRHRRHCRLDLPPLRVHVARPRAAKPRWSWVWRCCRGQSAALLSRMRRHARLQTATMTALARLGKRFPWRCVGKHKPSKSCRLVSRKHCAHNYVAGTAGSARCAQSDSRSEFILLHWSLRSLLAASIHKPSFPTSLTLHRNQVLVRPRRTLKLLGTCDRDAC